MTIAVFALGKIEGDRAHAQRDASQALLWAEAGLKRGAWALEQGVELQDVGTSLPEGIESLAAEQDGRTSGAVLCCSAPVTLTAIGEARGTQRVLRQDYLLDSFPDLYKHALASPGRIRITSSDPPSTLNGPVLTGDPETDLSAVLGDHPVTVGDVPQVDVGGYVASMLSSNPYTVVTSSEITNSSTENPYLMDGLDSTRVYYTNDPGLHVSHSESGASVLIRGTVFWLVENGASISKEFLISPADASARLVMVVTKDPNNNSGWDLDKLGVINVPTVIISDGLIFFNKESTLDNISIYGSEIQAAKGQNFTYDAATMDPFISDLVANGELPSPIDGEMTLTRLAGTWEEMPSP